MSVSERSEGGDKNLDLQPPRQFRSPCRAVKAWSSDPNHWLRQSNRHGHEFVTFAERATIRSGHRVLDGIGICLFLVDSLFAADQSCRNVTSQQFLLR